MLAPDRSNVRVAERAERETAGIQLLSSTAGRLLPFVPVLVCSEQIRELSLAVIEHGPFVNDPALSDHLVRESTETGLAIVGMFAATLCFKMLTPAMVSAAEFVLKRWVTSIERPSASALPLPPPGLAPAPPSPPPPELAPLSAPPASPELAPLSAPPASPGLAPLSAPPASPGLAPAPQPTVAVSGLVELLDIVQMGDKLEAATAWCKENDVNHIDQFPAVSRLSFFNTFNDAIASWRNSEFDTAGELAEALSLKRCETKRLLEAINVRDELADVLSSVELSDKLGSATAWCMESGVVHVAQLDEWGHARTQFVDALSLPLAKRDRLLEALKAFSTRYGQCSARKFPYSKLDEDRFVRGIEWAYANRQNDISRIERMFSPPSASPGLAPAPPPASPGLAPAPPPPTLPGLAELLDLFQMGDELEATTAFCAKYGITHVGIWARTMLGQDELSELKEMTAEYHESSPIPIESWQPADWVD